MPVEILLHEVIDGRVPPLAHIDPLDPDTFWGPGATVGDVDRDGRPDVYFAGAGLYLNQPDPLGFRLVASAAAAPALDLMPTGVAFGDFDRDGDVDLALCGLGGVRLWVNDGTGQFVDVTAAAGIAGLATDMNISVVWGDLDGDGYLDLIVTSYGLRDDPLYDAQASHLYLNQRDGTFAELPDPLAQPDFARRGIVAAFADVDGDGALDLYLGDDNGIPFAASMAVRHDLFLLNRGLAADGAPVLVESSAALGLERAHSTMGFAMGNVALGPGRDVFIADTLAGWLYRSTAPGLPFDDVTGPSGIDLSGPGGEQWIMWGGVFVDLDGDGYEELIVSQSGLRQTGDIGVANLGPVLLKNLGGEFEMVRYAFGEKMSVRAALPVDLDLDGDPDFIAVPFFDRFRVIQNDTVARKSVRVRLVATVGAPGAAGALIVATSGDVVQRRMVVAGGQPSSTGEEVVDLALGEADAADLVVTWPSGAVQTVAGVAAGTLVEVTEPAWITLSDATPPADGTTEVVVTVDVGAAGLGQAGTEVAWSSPGVDLTTVCAGAGVCELTLPARAASGAVHGTIAIGGRVVPAHPALDYQ